MEFKLQKVKTAQDLIKESWDTSIKNNSAYNYIAGMIDALRWAEMINEEEYAEAYERLMKIKSNEDW